MASSPQCPKSLSFIPVLAPPSQSVSHFSQTALCFIHIPKTAGTSIEALLEHSPKHVNRLPLLTGWLVMFLKWFLQFFAIPFVVQYFLPLAEQLSIVKNYHRKYEEYIRDGYDKPSTLFFTCVRHPLDRLYSLWSYGYNHVEFEQFVADIVGGSYDGQEEREVKLNPKETQVSYLTARSSRIDGAASSSTYIPTITILRYESLQNDWAAFCSVHGLQLPSEIPHKNASKKRTEQDWKEAYKRIDKNMMMALENIFEDDYLRLKYERMYC